MSTIFFCISLGLNFDIFCSSQQEETGAKKGEDVETGIEITLEEAFYHYLCFAY